MMTALLLLVAATVWETGGMVDSSRLRAFATGSSDTTEAGRETAVKEAVLREVGAWGFLEAAFETTATDTGRVLRLLPGRRYEVARVVIDGGAPVAARAKVRLERLAGGPYVAREVYEALEAVLRAHEEEGYPFASVGVRHYEADSTTAQLTLRIGITPGPRTTIQGLALPDTISTSERTAARLSRIRPGMVYRQSAIDEAVLRLRKTGYFATVGAPTLARGSTPDAVVVRIPLVERSTHHVRGAAGFGRDGALVGSVQASLRNIAGTAREATFSWEGRGEGRTDARLAYREPWIATLPPALDVEVRQAAEDTLWVEREGSAALTWDVGGGVLGSLGYRMRRVVPGAGPSMASLRSDEAWGQAVWDRQIPGIPPGGYWARLAVGYRTLRDLNTEAEVPVVRAEVEGRRFIALSPRLGLVAGCVGKAAVHGEDELPLPERFSVGGARSVRGYKEAQFRTDAVGWASVALHLGARGGRSSLFLFADGGAYRIDHRYEGILGFGPGIMATSTLGALEVAYGIPWGNDLLQGRIHLSLGRDF